MRRLIGLGLALFWINTAFAAAPVPPPALIALVKAELADAPDLRPGTPPPAFMFRPIDLDGDGHQDWRVDWERVSSGWCGTGGCRQLLFTVDATGALHRVLDVQVHEIKIFPAASGIPGRIEVAVYGGWCGGSGADDCRIALRYEPRTRTMVFEQRPTTTARLSGPLFRAIDVETLDPPTALAPGIARLVAACRAGGGKANVGDAVRFTPDLDGDGLSDAIVNGGYSDCKMPEGKVMTPPPPREIWLSGGGSWRMAEKITDAYYAIDLSTSPATYLSLDDGCSPEAPCPTRAFRWDGSKIARIRSDAITAEDLAELSAASDMASATRLETRIAASRAPDDVFLARTRVRLAAIAFGSGDKTRAEGAARRALDMLVFSGKDARADYGRAALLLARAIDGPGREGEATDHARTAWRALTEALGPANAEALRAGELYARGLDLVGDYDNTSEVLDVLLANGGGEGPDALAPRRLLLRIKGRTLRHMRKWSEAEAIERAVLADAEKADGPQSGSAAQSHAALALTALGAGRFADGESEARRALTIRTALGGADSADGIRAASDLGFALTQSGKLDEAETVLRGAIPAANTVLANDYARTELFRRLAETMLALGRNGEGEALLKQSLAIEDTFFAAGNYAPSDYDRTATTRTLVRALALRGALAEARTLLRQAIERTSGGPDDKRQQALLALDWLEWLDQGATAEDRTAIAETIDAKAPDAAGIAERASAMIDEAQPDGHPDRVRALLEVGRAKARAGRREDALASLEEVLTLAAALPGDGVLTGLSERTALAALLREDPATLDRALKLAREAMAIARERRARLRGGRGVASDREVRRAFAEFVGVADAVLKRTPADNALRDEAFRAAQDISVSQAGIAMAEAVLRRAALKPDLRTLVSAQQASARDAAALDRAYLEAAAAGSSDDVARLRQSSDAARGRASAADQALRHAFPLYAQLADQAPVSLTEVQRRLKANEVLLLIASDDLGIAVAVSRERMATAVARDFAGFGSAAIAKLRCSVEPSLCANAQPAFDAASSKALSAALIIPLETVLTPGATIYVTASGPIATIPLTLLQTADGAWLADRNPIVTLPSVTTLHLDALVRDSAAGASVAFMGFGDPMLSGGSADARGVARRAYTRGSGGLAAPSILAELAPLPGTGRELRAMAGIFKGSEDTLMLGRNATEGNVKRNAGLTNARIVAFATHGLMPSEIEGVTQPGLVFTPPTLASEDDDGLLTAAEAAALSLQAEWVILSACNTASADGTPGADSLSSLARGFLLAGARSVLASRWSVPDAATAALTVETLAARNRDPTLSRATALQQAMRTVRTGKRADGSALDGWETDWAHPKAWAAFTIVATGD